jgi:general L-amino acid transport system permease protein
MQIASCTAPVTRAIARPDARSVFWHWIRTNLFVNFTNTALTLVLAFVVLVLAAKLFNWGLFNAVFVTPSGDSSACRAAQGSGACWALIREKYRFILFATFPYDAQWRPAVACGVILLLSVLSAFPRFWTRWLFVCWALGVAAVATLMRGGILGLSSVGPELWGGLPVTLLLSVLGLAAAFPLGVLLALGRQADGLPLIRALSIGYIEVIRAVPLVSLLFMASFLLPIFLPAGVSVDKLLRAEVAFTAFAAAYLAEVVRAGLQGLSRGQYDAADALGLGYWRAHALIILPQALRSVIPALVNTSIAMLKNTSLVLIIGVFDLLSAGKAAIVDPKWQAFGIEMFIAVSLVYFAICFSMSRYSQWLEARWSRERDH